MLLPNSKAFFVVAFKISLCHQSVSPFLNGASPLKKNPGSAPTNSNFLGFLFLPLDMSSPTGKHSSFPLLLEPRFF